MRQALAGLLLAAPAALAAADGPAPTVVDPSPDAAARSVAVVAALPDDSHGLMHLYGMTRTGRPFDVPERLRLFDGWDLVLFRLEDVVAREGFAQLVACNERHVAVPDRETPELERVCSPTWSAEALPEPGSAAALGGAALVLALAARRRG